jgi:hypothetical protein
MAMVTRRNGTVTAFVSCALVLSAASCSVDVFGLLVANDFWKVQKIVVMRNRTGEPVLFP